MFWGEKPKGAREAHFFLEKSKAAKLKWPRRADFFFEENFLEGEVFLKAKVAIFHKLALESPLKVPWKPPGSLSGAWGRAGSGRENRRFLHSFLSPRPEFSCAADLRGRAGRAAGGRFSKPFLPDFR